jgi:hypothetical protein
VIFLYLPMLAVVLLRKRQNNNVTAADVPDRLTSA